MTRWEKLHADALQGETLYHGLALFRQAAGTLKRCLIHADFQFRDQPFHLTGFPQKQ